MIDIQKLKEKIGNDEIIYLMDRLGVPLISSTSQYLLYPSICHHPADWKSHKNKLYIYDGGIAHCYSCGFHGDIISLVCKIKSYDFMDAVNYICKVLKISADNIDLDENIDSWKKDLGRFLPGYEPPKEPLKIYDKSVLDSFEKFYHQSWLDDGISISSMDKYRIGWYGRNSQISIPVFDVDGNLVGIHARNTRKESIEKGYKYVPLRTLNQEYKFPTGLVLYGLYQNLEAIKTSKSVILFEAPKSVLQLESIAENNNSLALFGWNCTKAKRDMIVELGVNDVSIAIDKQYETKGDDKFKIYVKQVKKMADLFKPYCNVSVIWDNKGLLDYKNSPTDKGKDVFDKLYADRIKL